MYDYCLFVPIGNLCIFTLSVVNVFLTFSVGYPVFSWKVKQHWSVLTYWDKTQVSPSFHHTHYSLVTNYQINPFSHGVFDPGKKKIFKNDLRCFLLAGGRNRNFDFFFRTPILTYWALQGAKMGVIEIFWLNIFF